MSRIKKIEKLLKNTKRRKDRSRFAKRAEKLTDSIRSAYYTVIPYKYRPHQLWYRLKCFVWKRYTTIKPRYLSHQWCDRSTLLPHIMFEVLSDFIERECSPGHIDWEGTGHTVVVNGEEINVSTEMHTLYDWWHQDYTKVYPKTLEALWAEVFRFQPKHGDIPKDYDGNVVAEEDADVYEWTTIFDSEEQRNAYDAAMDVVHDVEREQSDNLTEMMHRLVNLRQYLWT